MPLSLASLTPIASPRGDAPHDLKGACRALEREFAGMVFRAMRQAMVPGRAGGADALARETVEGMLDLQWAELANQGRGLGLWEAMYRQVSGGSIKSGAPGADQKSEDPTHRKEAGHDQAGDH